MANVSSKDGSTMNYEAYIDEKWRTDTVVGIYTLETSTPSSMEVEDLEVGDRTPAQEPAGRHRPTGIKWFLIVFSILVGVLLFSLDNTIATDLQPTIVEEFQAVDQIAWVATGYFLATAALTLSSGQFFQVFNAKWLYVISVFVFEIGSAICGASPNMNILIIGRVVTGIGSTGIYTGSLFLLSVNTSDQERYDPRSQDLTGRPSYIGLIGAMWGLGSVLGPVVGGAFTDSRAGWRWAFYINLPIGALIAPVLLYLIPSFDAQKGMSYRKRMKKCDWIGSILLAATMVCLILAMTFGGGQYPWYSVPVVGCFLSASVLAILFAISQTLYMHGQTKQRRVFPVEMLFMKTTVLLVILSATADSIAIVTLYYIPLYFQFTKGDSAMKSAIRLLPMIFMMVTGSIGGGLLLSKIGYYTPFYIVGSGLGIIASAVLFRTTTDTSDTVIYLFTALTGLGTGISAQAAFSVAQVKVPKDQVGKAIAFLSTGQLMGVVVSLAICGTCMLNTAISGLASVLPDLSPQVIESVVAGTAGNTLQSLPPDLRDAALEVIVSSINKVYIVTLSAASVGLICSLCLKHERIFPGSGREEKSES